MRLRALLETSSLGLRLLGGEAELDRTVRGVMTTDLRDPSRYLSGGELVLTGLAWRRTPEDSEPFVRILAAAGVAGLAAGEAELGAVPEDMVVACNRHRLPLFAVDEDVAFATITEHVVRQVSTERAGDLAAVVDRHRRLMSSGPAGGGADVVLDLLDSDLDLRAWVLSPTGRPVAGAGTVSGAGTGAGSAAGTGAGSAAGTGAGSAAGGRSAAAGTGAARGDTVRELPATVRARLAGEHLAAVRTGRPGPYRATVDGVAYTLFPVRTGEGDLRQTVLSDWLLAVEADAGDWPAERLDLLDGVTQLIAVERDRRDASRTVRRRLAQEVLELVQSGAPPAETAARLRVAAPVLLPGLGTAPHWQVVVARVEWGQEGEKGEPIDGGPVAQALLEELLVGPGTAEAGGAAAADRVAVAHTGGEAVALVPLPATATGADTEADADAEAGGGSDTGAGGESGGGGISAGALLESVREPMERGLSGDGRLTLGVSATVHSAEGLRGALEEARHARRVAAARRGTVCAAGHEELASHVLLLPFVPDDVRRAFTARLLDPLRDYDRRHRAELIPTLEAFLAADGSWTRCAARLHLHVNTLRYRMGRIEQLTGRDLSRLEDKLDFFLALRIS
ncbi:PucR family transcriptional regulator [Streptomyces armeniacus]|uniref:PucR family transcriptional regulator n=1 Tax=Streptomyces armeniacus TaxID=83291 RepID=A0A345XSL3_9ACTN|nr:PucR family transcriptional regulator ligand-binding domain-containing protein [Streptomyces armeniacus]AXK34629.1 PucR family transcriptional regulator [Streptomyces armeniacus]